MLKCFLITAFFLARALAAPTLEGACASSAHIITVRESSAPRNSSFALDLAKKVQASIPGSDIEDVDYPAQIWPYFDSEKDGVVKARALIEDYVKQCPQTGIALLGYSQGAHVIGDILCGNKNKPFALVDPLPITDLGDHVKAVILMGDPAHAPGASFDVGTSTNPGRFDRKTDIQCPGYADKIQSYCDHDDFFCDSGLSMPVHNSYIGKYADQAVEFVASKV